MPSHNEYIIILSETTPNGTFLSLLLIMLAARRGTIEARDTFRLTIFHGGVGNLLSPIFSNLRSERKKWGGGK